MTSGWMWTIPTYDDLAHGYVYSDKYIDKDDAESEVEIEHSQFLHLDLKIYGKRPLYCYIFVF